MFYLYMRAWCICSSYWEFVKMVFVNFCVLRNCIVSWNCTNRMYVCACVCVFVGVGVFVCACALASSGNSVIRITSRQRRSSTKRRDPPLAATDSRASVVYANRPQHIAGWWQQHWGRFGHRSKSDQHRIGMLPQLRSSDPKRAAPTDIVAGNLDNFSNLFI